MKSCEPEWSDECQARYPNIGPYRADNWDVHGFYYPDRPFTTTTYMLTYGARPPRPWRHT